MDKVKAKEPWFGIEQENTLFETAPTASTSARAGRRAPTTAPSAPRTPSDEVAGGEQWLIVLPRREAE